MAKRNWMNEILGGQIWLHSGVLRQVWFILYIFFLVIFYITIDFSMEQSLLTERRNMRELVHLKSDYTSKSSRLQYESKRIEVENKLKRLNSTLKTPENPPKRILAE